MSRSSGPISSPRSRGRPRSETTRAAILRAADDMLQRDGFPALTVEAIAARAHASKATVYRWWPNKAAVVMDAFFEHYAPPLALPDTGSALEDLRHRLKAVITTFNDTPAGTTIAALIAESQHDPTLARAFRERLIAPLRAESTANLQRGQQRGELREDLQPGIVIDALYGALYYRLLVNHERTEVGYADELLAQFHHSLVAS